MRSEAAAGAERKVRLSAFAVSLLLALGRGVAAAMPIGPLVGRAFFAEREQR